MKSKDASLEALLVDHGIDVSLFGQGQAKTKLHLLKEINEGECLLVEVNGRLVRRVQIVAVDVYADVNSQQLRLVEDYQRFTDGRVRERKQSNSLSEKLLPEEAPLQALSRALQEELDVTRFRVMSDPTEKLVVSESPSYPGLISEYLTTQFSIQIDPADFQPDGYVEVQPDKSTYFRWIKI